MSKKQLLHLTGQTATLLICLLRHPPIMDLLDSEGVDVGSLFNQVDDTWSELVRCPNAPEGGGDSIKIA